ncbi:MAG TPA: hypothetical protein VNT99_20820 [Methylomirabilota bacterium]|nr:hypothetical protein [Methylomirabilota bacterium]
MRSVERPVIPNVLFEHLEELGYLFIQRRKLLFSSEIPLRRLRLHEQRIEAHLDGLRVGEAASVQIALEKLVGDDPWLITAAARVWLTQGEPAPAKLIELLATVSPDLSIAWKEALRAIPTPLVQKVLPPKSAMDFPPVVQAIAADAWGWHGLLSPGFAAELQMSPHSAVRFSVARHSGGADKLLGDTDPMVRRAALWALARGSASRALDYSRQAARSAPPDLFALRILGLMGEKSDGRLLVSALSQPTTTLPALWALRDLAHPEYADHVVDLLEAKNEDVAAAAREVFESLAGPLPPPDPQAPIPSSGSPARYRWQQMRGKLDLNNRKLRGQPFPWTSDPADEPMELVWRRACVSAKPETDWLRREVPDGFFAGVPSPVAVPGE